MAGVFLSHSSKDKSFVTRLAADLTSRGIPVWFDTWEMEAGDSLYERIFQGIDACTLLILVISPNSVSSKWVQRELEGAFAREDKLGRKVVIPIRIGSCDIPLAVAARVYVDFTTGYLEGVERLEDVLRGAGAGDVVVPADRQLMPLQFSNGLFLRQVALQDRLAQLIRQTAGVTFRPQQFVVAGDDRYDEMRSALTLAIEGLPNDPRYSPQLEDHFDTLYEHVRKLERALIDGVVAIANGLVALNDWGFFSLAAHWYCRLIRNEILWRLREAWTFKREGEPPLASGFYREAIGSSKSAAKLFEVSSVMSCDVFQTSSDECIRVWVDQASEVGAWFTNTPQNHQPLKDFWTPHFVYKFVVPQMVARHFAFAPSTPLVWNFADWRIGAA